MAGALRCVVMMVICMCLHMHMSMLRWIDVVLLPGWSAYLHMHASLDQAAIFTHRIQSIALPYTHQLRKHHSIPFTNRFSHLLTLKHKTPHNTRKQKQYSEALDIIPSSSSNSSSTSRQIWHPQPQPQPAATTRLRSRATLKDASGRPAEEQGVDGERQVDFYMGRTRREAEKELEGKGKGEGEASYLFCPQAFGLMEQALGSEYWRHVEAFLALPEGEQRAVMLQQRRALSQEQQEEEGRRMNSTVTGEVNNDPHQLVLLVPARAVDWGNGQGGQQQQQQQGGDAWLEVGCRLTSMRLVTDVRFPPSASSV